VIDVLHYVILFHTYMVNGKNIVSLFASRISNVLGSYQRSLGFYLTGGTYYGKNGYTMYLDGPEKGIIHVAKKSAIVMHEAWYTTEKFIQEYGRLGRSFGCPAIPPKIHRDLINTISDRFDLLSLKKKHPGLPDALFDHSDT